MTQNPVPDVKSTSDTNVSMDLELKLVIGSKLRQVNYQQAFALGHSLLKGKSFEAAGKIFERLVKVSGRGPRAHIMLAICKAGQSDYKGARWVLDQAFEGEQAGLLASEIQDVIVNARLGFKQDALNDLVELVNEHKSLPTLCLWLGDLLEANQRLDKAIQCWKLAVRRDHPDGAVALAALGQLRRFGK